MNNLIHAELYRLIKNKLFGTISIVFAVFASAMRLYVYFVGKKTDAENISTDVGIFGFVILIGIAMAVFCSIFIGTEHSDGTIRNKLIVGHTRISVYLSKLIVCFLAGIVFDVTYIIFSLGIGMPLSGFIKQDAKAFFSMLAIILMLTLAYTSIFVFIAMVMHNKAGTAVISLIIAFMLIFISSAVTSMLNEPESYDAYSYTENGETHYEPAMKNPNYLTGTKKQFVEFLYDFLPGCQTMRLAGATQDPDYNWILSFYSGIIFIYMTVSGIVIFRKKDIK